MCWLNNEFKEEYGENVELGELFLSSVFKLREDCVLKREGISLGIYFVGVIVYISRYMFRDVYNIEWWRIIWIFIFMGLVYDIFVKWIFL